MSGNEVNRAYLILGDYRRYHFEVHPWAGGQIDSVKNKG